MLTINAAQGLLANDTDSDADLLTASVVSGHNVQHGTLVIQGTGSFVYTPTTGYVGSDTFRYQITDGVTTTQADVQISVLNRRPVGEDDKYGAVAGQTLTVTAANGEIGRAHV